jgi:hypothetical protein
MAAEWAAVRPVLLQLAADLSAADAAWEDQPDAYVRPKAAAGKAGRAVLSLSIGPVTSWGQDELRTEFVEGRVNDADEPAEYRDTAVGQRRIPLNIRCDSLDQRDDATAFTYLERLRTRLAWRSSVAALSAVKVAVSHRGEATPIQTTVDDHAASRAILSVILWGVFAETDPVGYTYIETVSGTYKYGDGPEIPFGETS